MGDGGGGGKDGGLVHGEETKGGGEGAVGCKVEGEESGSCIVLYMYYSISEESFLDI